MSGTEDSEVVLSVFILGIWGSGERLTFYN